MSQYSNIGRSDNWKTAQVAAVLDRMMKSNRALYDLVTETTGFAYHFNCLTLLAQHQTWSLQDVEDYLRTGSKKRKDWEKPKV